jgi:type II secretory pathway pseudopilin PulG
MPKSVPKQKPLATKKNKLPMSILGLLGLALVLVGIVAAIGLTQINQDGRGQANESSAEERARQDRENVEAARERDAQNKRQEKQNRVGQPTNIKATCTSNGGIKIRFKLAGGSADTFYIAGNSSRIVPGSASCPSPVDGWACADDFGGYDPAKGKDYLTCSTNWDCQFQKAPKKETYDTIAVRAFKNGQNKVGQISVNLKCN